jgi:hypothetical protein
MGEWGVGWCLRPLLVSPATADCQSNCRSIQAVEIVKYFNTSLFKPNF